MPGLRRRGKKEGGGTLQAGARKGPSSINLQAEKKKKEGLYPERLGKGDGQSWRKIERRPLREIRAGIPCSEKRTISRLQIETKVRIEKER